MSARWNVAVINGAREVVNAETGECLGLLTDAAALRVARERRQATTAKERAAAINIFLDRIRDAKNWPAAKLRAIKDLWFWQERNPGRSRAIHHPTLAEELEVSTDTVRRWFRDFEGLGLMTRTKIGVRGAPRLDGTSEPNRVPEYRANLGLMFAPEAPVEVVELKLRVRTQDQDSKMGAPSGGPVAESVHAPDAIPAHAGTAPSACRGDPPAPSGIAATVFFRQREEGGAGDAPPFSEAENAGPPSPEFQEDLGGCRESLGRIAEFDAARARPGARPPAPPRETRPRWTRAKVEAELAELRAADSVSRPAPPPATVADAANLAVTMGKREWREDLRREDERRAARAEERRREEEERRRVRLQQLAERLRVEEVAEWKAFRRRTGWAGSLEEFRERGNAVRYPHSRAA